MGYYINPLTESKESFLNREGVEVYDPSYSSDPNSMLVCLVDNGPFTAAGIAYSQSEFDTFNDQLDYRPRRWFRVPHSKLLKVSNFPH